MTWRSTLGTAGAVALGSGLVHIAASAYTMWPNGSEGALWFSLFFVAPLLVLALLAPLLGVFLLPFRARRSAGLRLIVAGLLFLGVLSASMRVANGVRMCGFTALAERSAPLVHAIERYEQEHGRPPERLGNLVPRHLEKIPGTGIAAYPLYDYFVGEEAQSTYGDRWALSVFTPSGGINFDQFYYIPSGDYPTVGLGGVIERVGDWAYVYE